MDISGGEGPSSSHVSHEEEDTAYDSQLGYINNTDNPNSPDVEALITTATQMAGSAECSSLALASLQADNPRDALILLAACSTQTSIDVKRTNNTAVSALVKAQLAEEGNTNSDYTYEIRWKQQREENEMLRHRVDRLESVLKQLVSMVVQTRGTDDDQVAEMMRNLGL
ncbi:hypothetical protein N0V93_007708 [Gnomoniopsis smithogilvyi]|uniref:Uncharacterized protein n=1 Tax=Gnomoniopsis smithogilvyi TaxID=1191159 RepID=A0A9W9CT28_9PEZI|nr:hypothetical protein N0V93_007708 [Gnomoniopsis smithogilvyi]